MVAPSVVLAEHDPSPASRGADLVKSVTPLSLESSHWYEHRTLFADAAGGAANATDTSPVV